MAVWTLKQSSIDIAKLARETELSPVLARLFAVRGYREASDIKGFLEAGLDDLPNPLLFSDIEKAVVIAKEAIEKDIPCAIFGDYDVDGIMSTVILSKGLEFLGQKPVYHIPVREDGYGLNNIAIKNLFDQGIRIIFACDNGITAIEQIKYANSLGMRVIVLDHHDLLRDANGTQILPKAAAVIDANREDCSYPFKKYCAAGVCYRFIEALFAKTGENWLAIRDDLLQYAAIATICDIVDISSDNRVLVKAGLILISKTSLIGLKSLLTACNIHDIELDAYHIGFIIGPCINASGRLTIADLAVNLFLSTDISEAMLLAEKLVTLNHERRNLTEEGTALAVKIIEENKLHKNKIIVVSSNEIMESVAGIIAGRIKEKFYRPSIVIGGRGELLHGSCRSVEGYNIFAGISECQEFLPEFGGHPMAAGLTICSADIPAFAQKINNLCKLTENDFQPSYRIDLLLSVAKANLNFAKELQKMEPFGHGNPRPLFADTKLCLERLTIMGKTERALRWHFRDGKGMLTEAVSFNGKDRLKTFIEENYKPETWDELIKGRVNDKVFIDIIYTLSVNLYNERESAQLQIVDFRLAK